MVSVCQPCQGFQLEWQCCSQKKLQCAGLVLIIGGIFSAVAGSLAKQPAVSAVGLSVLVIGIILLILSYCARREEPQQEYEPLFPPPTNGAPHS